jgi:transposase-like protein
VATHTTRNDPPSPTPANQSLPDPEVSERPKRRRFPAAYKLRIVQEADAAVEFGRVGALLRREGLYSSQLSVWRRLVRRRCPQCTGQAPWAQAARSCCPRDGAAATRECAVDA